MLLLLLVVAGCACPKADGWIDEDRTPDHVTPGGVRLWFMGNLDTPNRRQLDTYLDTVEDYLRDNGIDLSPPKVGLWQRGELFHKGKSVGGIAYIGAHRCPIAVVWLLPDAYPHERLHQAGWKHKKLSASTLDEEAHLAGIIAMTRP